MLIRWGFVLRGKILYCIVRQGKNKMIKQTRDRTEYFRSYYQRPEVAERDRQRRIKRKKAGYYKDYWKRNYVQEKNRQRVRNTQAEKMKRLNLKNECAMCGWKESICDIHHISTTEIIVLCPNHHRILHRGRKITKK